MIHLVLNKDVHWAETDLGISVQRIWYESQFL